MPERDHLRDVTKGMPERESGYYWVHVYGADRIAKLNTAGWWLPGDDGPLSDPVAVLYGPIRARDLQRTRLSQNPGVRTSMH